MRAHWPGLAGKSAGSLIVLRNGQEDILGAELQNNSCPLWDKTRALYLSKCKKKTQTITTTGKTESTSMTSFFKVRK